MIVPGPGAGSNDRHRNSNCWTRHCSFYLWSLRVKMRRKSPFLFPLILLCLSAYSQAQLWSGVLDPSRAVDWTQAGVQGGIPSITAQCGSTIAAFGSSSAYASPAPINIAITGCPAGQFVQLGSGDFYLNSGITWNGTSGVVLRGMGANNTRLHFSNINSCGGLGAVACLIDSSPVYQDSTAVQPGGTQAANWTAGYTAGATSLTIASVGSAGIKNGQWIFLDQNLQEIFVTLSESGTTATATAAGKLPSTFTNGATLRLFNASVAGYNTMTATLSNVNRSAGTFQYTTASAGLGNATGGVAVVDNGSLVMCESYQLCGYAGAQSSSDGIGRNVNGSRRQIFQAVQVVAGCSSRCSGAGPFTITISPGLYIPADSGMSPGIWWPTQVTSDGIEELLLDQSANTGGNTGTGGIVMYDCFGCWAKAVAETDAWLNHVWLFQSAQDTIESGYFYGVHSGGGIESYGVESYMASNNLIQNNIFQQISAPFMGGPTEGTVFAYNYALNDPSGAASVLSAMVWATHDVDQYSLFEGNIGPQGRADSTFANGDFNTFFRNRFTGADYADGQQKSVYTYPVGLEFWNRFYNLIGNVLGTNGYHNNYESSPNVCGSSCNNASASIYVFGFAGAANQTCTNSTYCPPDSNVATTVMRWGNYDTVNAAVRFANSEVPSGLAQYANAVPGSQALPASFYLNSVPSFFNTPQGTLTWPLIGPDVSGGNLSGSAGYANLNPAANCYINIMGGPSNGTGSALSFNADNCYYAAGDPPPNAPTGLNAVVQ
jgi:hypothetical protein